MFETTQACSSTLNNTALRNTSAQKPKYNAGLQLILKPSRLYTSLIFLCHLLALSGLLLSLLPVLWSVVGSILLFLSLIYQVFRYWTGFPLSLSWDGRGWWLNDHKAVLLHDASIYPHWINVFLRVDGDKVNLVILADSVDSSAGRAAGKDLLRRLRFILLNLDVREDKAQAG